MRALAHTKQVSPTQELVALGVANILGSFFSAIAVTGSVSRTAVNAACHVKTPLAGLLVGIIVIIAIEELTGAFKYIPKACLAAVIMTAVWGLIEWRVRLLDHTCFVGSPSRVQVPIHIWKVSKPDLIPYTCCLIFIIFFGIEFASLRPLGAARDPAQDWHGHRCRRLAADAAAHPGAVRTVAVNTAAHAPAAPSMPTCLLPMAHRA